MTSPEAGPDGIVISPGPGIPADAGVSVNVVRACAAMTPLLGICLGHQAIAAAYGARIAAAPQPVHGQAALITHDGGGLLAGLPPRFPAARYHSLIVNERSLPPGLLITARGPGAIPMGLRHTEHPAEGLQFHPESILTPHGDGIIANFARAVRSASAPGAARRPRLRVHRPAQPSGQLSDRRARLGPQWPVQHHHPGRWRAGPWPHDDRRSRSRPPMSR